jgi:hypothetical protein
VDRVRAIWRDDPATTITIAWDEIESSDYRVYFGTTDEGRNVSRYPRQGFVFRIETYKGMRTEFARLSSLDPDTTYYFVISGDQGTSRRYSFRTAPDRPQSFTFITGGDSRNNREPRQEANLLVRKLRPLFVAFSGDMTDDDTAAEWKNWLDDWELTTSADGHLIPIVPARGNHEDSNDVLYRLFDLPRPENYYALSVAGDLMRMYALNSEMVEGGNQADWLENDLETIGADHAFRFAFYHKPMRPHTSGKSEGSGEYAAWAQLFFDHNVQLVEESDSHVMKRTYPLRPDTSGDEGFVTDFADGTVYIGEGCWGAPLRSANDGKSWTAATGSFNGFDWVHVYPGHAEVRTVRIDTSASAESLTDADPFRVPAGLDLWTPDEGAVLSIPFKRPAYQQQFSLPVEDRDRFRYLDTGVDPGPDWMQPDFDDSAWEEGPGQLGYGDGDESTTVSFGGNAADKHITTYFRKDFFLGQPEKYQYVLVEVVRDDGIALYINGTEIARNNLAAGPLGNDQFAPRTVATSDEDKEYRWAFPKGLLRPGMNTVAARVHQRSASSSDLSFALNLFGASDPGLFTLTYAGYQEIYDGQGSPVGLANDDDDRDLIRNEDEFFFGATNPKTYTAPTGFPTADVDGDDLIIEFTIARGLAMPRFLLSEDLVTWEPAVPNRDYIFNLTEDPEAPLSFKVRIRFRDTEPDRLFFRLDR